VGKENRKSVAFFHVSEKTQVLGEKREEPRTKGIARRE